MAKWDEVLARVHDIVPDVGHGGGEGMGQDNAAAVVENGIVSGMQRAQPVRDVLGGEVKRCGEVVSRLDAATARQLASCCRRRPELSIPDGR